MSKEKHNSRRSFLKKLGGTTALVAGGPMAWEAAASTPPQVLKTASRVSPNSRIRVATIGMGIMGFGNARTALKIPGIELAAVCDLYDGRLIRAREVFGKNIFVTRSYKEILDRKDIDAVIISTPDHWHDRISIDAMNSGKAVFCEKPMVHQLSQGLEVISTQKRTKAVFQVGSQRVSSLLFAKAKALYEAGEIGELNFVEANTDRHSALGAWQYSIPPDASGKTIDWDAFLGDAPKVPFDPVRFFRWRNYRDYGTGVPGDLFVHLISGLHFTTGSLGPTRIMSTGGLHMWKDGRDIPDLMTAMCEYPKTDKHPAFTLAMRVNLADGSGGGGVTRLVGSEGEMELGNGVLTIRKHQLPEAPGYGGWDSFDTFPEAIQQQFEKEYKEKYAQVRPKIQPPQEMKYAVPQGYDERLDHFINFFEAIRDAKPVVEDASFGLRAAGPALASNLSYFDKKIIHWDPVNMNVLDKT